MGLLLDDSADQQIVAKVQACLDGDSKAYAHIVQEFEAYVTRRMKRFDRNRHEHEELVHRVFVRAYYALPSYRGKGPFLHWLSAICTRVGYDYWQEVSQRRSRQHEIEQFGSAVRQSEDMLRPGDAAELMHTLLALLPCDDRLVLTLLYLEDRSTREIAKQMGWSRAMVKMRALRARRRLKQIAEEQQLLEKLGWTR